MKKEQVFYFFLFLAYKIQDLKYIKTTVRIIEILKSSKTYK